VAYVHASVTVDNGADETPLAGLNQYPLHRQSQPKAESLDEF
jgi:hypothetical protein